MQNAKCKVIVKSVRNEKYKAMKRACTMRYRPFAFYENIFNYSWGVMRHPTPPQGACTKSLRLLPPFRRRKVRLQMFFLYRKTKVTPLLRLSPKTEPVFGGPIKKSSSTISEGLPRKSRRLPSSRRHAPESARFLGHVRISRLYALHIAAKREYILQTRTRSVQFCTLFFKTG